MVHIKETLENNDLVVKLNLRIVEAVYSKG